MALPYTGDRVNHPIAHLIHLIKEAPDRHHPWGFIICRITYSDQHEWDNFIAEIKRQILDELRDEREPGGAELEQHLQLTVLEDEQWLNGATMLDASLYFLRWWEDQGGPITDPLADEVPRCNFFIYGNAESVDSVTNPARKEENFFCLVYASRCKENKGAPYNDDCWLRVRVSSFVIMYSVLVNWDSWWLSQRLHPRIIDC